MANDRVANQIEDFSGSYKTLPGAARRLVTFGSG